jgi:hypothetical protein
MTLHADYCSNLLVRKREQRFERNTIESQLLGMLYYTTTKIHTVSIRGQYKTSSLLADLEVSS